MIIIEDEGLPILRIDHSAYAGIARTQVAVIDVFRQLLLFLFHRAAAPGAVLAMGSNYYPFFPQRMPTLFPNHFLTLLSDCNANSSQTYLKARHRSGRKTKNQRRALHTGFHIFGF